MHWPKRGACLALLGFSVFSLASGHGCLTSFGDGKSRTDAEPQDDCGNGALQEGEECDDGNREDGDGCSAQCHVEPGWFCEDMPSRCVFTCLDGVRQTWEVCDGTDLDGERCETLGLGFKGGDLACSDNCVFDTGMCIAPVCGDGELDFGEECDLGEANSNQGECLTTCVKATCGDGFVWAGVEECDDGAENSDTEPFLCRTDCQASMEATGGDVSDITVEGRRWRVHVFLASGTWTVHKIGSLGNEVEYLVVGGGGGGGSPGYGGGGGAGGVFSARTTVVVGDHSVVVGQGGGPGTSGAASTCLGISSSGGGRGGASATSGASGGCGGGAGGFLDLPGPSRSGGSGHPGLRGGNVGGSSTGRTGGAGGGGMSAHGEDTPGDRRRGGHGGDGMASSITGTTVAYAGGGGGMGTGGGTGGTGGTGGGGNGSTEGGAAATSGVNGTGGGGGGGGGRGGSGIVVIRYPLEP